MPNLDAFLGDDDRTFDYLERDTASDTQLLINEQGVMVSLLRGSTVIPNQKVVLTTPGRGDESENIAGGLSGKGQLLMIGLPSLNVKAGDLFKHQGMSYRVNFVDKSVPGATQASIEATQ